MDQASGAAIGVTDLTLMDAFEEPVIGELRIFGHTIRARTPSGVVISLKPTVRRGDKIKLRWTRDEKNVARLMQVE